MPRADSEPSPHFPFSDGAGEVRVQLLAHTVAAAMHLDFLVAARADADGADPDARIARAWRLPCEAFSEGALAAGEFDALELPPHRAFYLTLAEPVELSGGRGLVEPTTRFETHAEVRQRGDFLAIHCAAATISAARAHLEHWRFTVHLNAVS